MRTLQVIEGLGRGGAERLVVDSTLALNARGVSSIVLHRGGPLATELGGATEELSPGPRYLGWRRPLTIAGVDVIHCHSLAPLFGAKSAARRIGAKLVFTVHGWSANKFGPAGAALKVVKPDAVIAVSRGVQEQLAHHGVPSLVVPNAVPDQYAGQALPPRSPLVGRTAHFVHVGRLVPVKRHDVLLRAFATLVNEGRDAHLHIVGEGPLEQDLKAQAQALGVDGKVTFHGFVNPHPILAASDCYVSSSDHEGLSLAQLEAMMSGLPLVVTATEGVEELVDSSNGIVVPVADPDALASGMATVVEGSSASLGKSSRVKYEASYTFDAYTERLIQLYSEL